MKTAILPLLAWLLVAAPLRAQETKPAAPPTEHPWHFFGVYDYFLPQDVGHGLNNQLQGQAAALTAQGFSLATFSVKTQGGSGTRVGFLHKVDKQSDLGLSFGYIIGPTMNSSFNAVGPPGLGSETINRDVIYLRYLVEGHFNFPISDHWTFSMGSGFGLATGRVDQSCAAAGSVVCPVTSARKTWTGFAWEFTPSATYHMKTANLIGGVRYAGFPEFNGNAQIADIDWVTYGFFLGASF
jgi:hypothetical protein